MGNRICSRVGAMRVGAMRDLHRRPAITAILLLACALPAFAKDPVTVRLWNWNIHDKKYQQKMYKQFNQAHPDTRIEYSSISSTVYDTTLEAAMIAENPPDLFLPSGKIQSCMTCWNAGELKE